MTEAVSRPLSGDQPFDLVAAKQDGATEVRDAPKQAGLLPVAQRARSALQQGRDLRGREKLRKGGWNDRRRLGIMIGWTSCRLPPHLLLASGDSAHVGFLLFGLISS